jgi:hypothetical protein
MSQWTGARLLILKDYAFAWLRVLRTSVISYLLFIHNIAARGTICVHGGAFVIQACSCNMELRAVSHLKLKMQNYTNQMSSLGNHKCSLEIPIMGLNSFFHGWSVQQPTWSQDLAGYCHHLQALKFLLHLLAVLLWFLRDSGV